MPNSDDDETDFQAMSNQPKPTPAFQSSPPKTPLTAENLALSKGYESRSTTPELDIKSPNEKSYSDNASEDDPDAVERLGVGLLSDEVYERTLSPWRVAIRRRLLKNLVWESNVIGAMQVCQPNVYARRQPLNFCQCRKLFARRS